MKPLNRRRPSANRPIAAGGATYAVAVLRRGRRGAP